MKYGIGGDMGDDIQHLSEISDETAKCQRIVKQAEGYILESGRQELIDDWDNLTGDEKLMCAKAVILAFNTKKDQNTKEEATC